MKKTAIILALGFEFIGLVIGGAFLGHILGKTLKIQPGVGEAIGSLLGLISAMMITYKVLKILKR